MESRIRSRAKGPHQLVITANPKYDHTFLLKFVTPYLDPITGIPRKEEFAKEKYYGSYQGEIVVANTKEELEEKYPGIRSQTYTFVAATIYDNPRMKILNPAYVDRLENLKRVERERLLLGSWFAKPSTAGLFKRDWVEEIDTIPDDVVTWCRGMDLAGTLASESSPNPDWTASVLIGKTKTGHYIVAHVERYRKLINGVLENIVETDKRDKELIGDVVVKVPSDVGQAGKASSMFTIKYLVEAGVDARAEKISGYSKKTAKMQPFLSLAEAGLVKVVRGEWNSMWYNELEDYIDGNRNQKDDMWDATGTASLFLIKEQAIPSFSLPSFTQPSPIPSI